MGHVHDGAGGVRGDIQNWMLQPEPTWECTFSSEEMHQLENLLCHLAGYSPKHKLGLGGSSEPPKGVGMACPPQYWQNGKPIRHEEDFLASDPEPEDVPVTPAGA